MMKTKILNFTEITSAQLSQIANDIKKGAVIICPTDTIYGLSSSAENSKALKKIHLLKKRLKKKPFIFLVSSLNKLKDITAIDKRVLTLAKKFWPGPLTMVLKAKGRFEKMKTLAVRVPADKKLLLLLKKTGFPIVSTSANISGTKSLSTKAAIIKTFDGKVDYILLSNIKTIKPSTIIDLTEKAIIILREGVIPSKKIINNLVF
jgi:L-threonylcarbamoyladenylate synthase